VANITTGGLYGLATSGTVKNIVGGLTGQTQANAAVESANIQANAANVANQDIMSMFNTNVGNLAPFRTTGANALTSMNNMSPTNAASWQDPGYQFSMTQGQNALSSQAAAAGNYGSGNMGVALQNFGQGMGAQEYQDVWNRQYNLANMGENAAAQTGSMGANAMSQVGSNTIGAGKALGTGVTSAAGYQTTGMQNLWNMIFSGIGIPTSWNANALSYVEPSGTGGGATLSPYDLSISV
jgi:hypothetical protein